jgi:DNA invertase Pin-like site-specific DNA recombinase
MIYGYARCSTNETKQDIDRQKRELIAAGVPKENIFSEYESGAKDDRIELNRLFCLLKADDVVITTEVSRLARSTKKLCELLDIIQRKKVCLQILGSMTLDCRPGHEADPATVAMIQVMAAFSEMERKMISSRVKSGMQNAKAKGKRIGRPEVSVESIPNDFYRYYSMYKDGQINKTEMAKLSGIARGTVYKYINVIEGQSSNTKKAF